MEIHRTGCAQLERTRCKQTEDGIHNWSGWPGAYCLRCGEADPDEDCLADCSCECHEAFWKGYEEFLRKEAENEKKGKT